MSDASSHIPPRDLPPESRSTGDLIQTAFQHVNGLIRGEIALARAEAEVLTLLDGGRQEHLDTPADIAAAPPPAAAPVDGTAPGFLARAASRASVPA